MRVRGTTADETLNGTEKADIIWSGGGADLIYGKGGADTVYLSATGTKALGDAGDDRFLVDGVVDGALSEIDGGEGVDEFDLSLTPFGRWTWSDGLIHIDSFSLTDVEVLRGASLTNFFSLTQASRELTVLGGPGSDRFEVSSTARSISFGYAGNDSFRIAGTGSEAYGGDGNDNFDLIALAGTSGIIIDGEGGSDSIYLDAGGYVDLTAGVAVTDGVAYAIKSVEAVSSGYLAQAEFYGSADNDNLSVSFYSTGSIIDGRAGSDWISGGSGADRLFGGDGNDVILGRGSGDYIDGGAGVDTVDYTAYQDALSIELRNRRAAFGSPSGESEVLTNVENIIGSLFSVNNLTGNNFDNALTGGWGDDRLSGGRGDDVLRGSSGADTLEGGRGADIFLYQSLSDSQHIDYDTILDFNPRKGDKIVLTLDASEFTEETDDFVFIGTEAFTGAGGELRYEINDGKTMVLGDLYGGGYADFLIELRGEVLLTADAFVL